MRLTLVVPFYDNAAMLAVQLAGWSQWPEKLKARTEIILVDDGSPVPALEVDRPADLPSLRIYRVLEDRPWHQHGARNLGAYEADDGWMLLTDMDHVLTIDSAQSLFKAMDKGKLDTGAIYMMDRVEADTGKPTLSDRGQHKPHPNSFVVTRETFWRIGGYDEEFVGYGTDSAFKERAFRIARRDHLRIPLARYSCDLVVDASTRTLGRKDSEYRCDRQAVINRKIAEGRQDEILTLDFPWERVL